MLKIYIFPMVFAQKCRFLNPLFYFEMVNKNSLLKFQKNKKKSSLKRSISKPPNLHFFKGP